MLKSIFLCAFLGLVGFGSYCTKNLPSSGSVDPCAGVDPTVIADCGVVVTATIQPSPTPSPRPAAVPAHPAVPSLGRGRPLPSNSLPN